MADAASIAAVVGRAIAEAAVTLRPDVEAALRGSLAAEPSERGRAVIAQLLENAEVAARERVPLCQDTGTVRVLIELAEGAPVPVGLGGAVDAAVAEAYSANALRASTVRDALCDRSNPGDNTPAFVELGSWPGPGARVTVGLKGGGSDNASVLRMLDPADGPAGVVRAVVDAVLEKGANACPPLIVGVGVGGTFDSVGRLGKKALSRRVGTRAEGAAGELEAELLAAVNATGIGPAGLGGLTTALAVHVVTAPCHIAALPVAVCLGCCAMREIVVEVP